MVDNENEERPSIDLIAEEEFEAADNTHTIITFLNKSLKYKGFIFGMSKVGEGRIKITIYEVKNLR